MKDGKSAGDDLTYSTNSTGKTVYSRNQLRVSGKVGGFFVLEMQLFSFLKEFFNFEGV